MQRLVVLCGGLSLLLQACTASPLLSVSFTDLDPQHGAHHRHPQANLIGDALSNDGIIAITNVPNFKAIRRSALLAVGDCLANPPLDVSTNGEPAVTKIILPDGTERFSILTKTTRKVQSPLSDALMSECTELQASTEPLRDTISSVARSLAGALDAVFSPISDTQVQRNQKPFFVDRAFAESQGAATGTVWPRFSNLVGDGDQLEHFHSYSQQSQTAKAVKTAQDAKTIEYHTDAGLFILFTPALYSDDIFERRGDHADFKYLDRDGVEHSIVVQSSADKDALNSPNVHVVAPDTVILMMGQGAEQYLNPVLQNNMLGEYTKLRAVPHALTMSSGKDDTEVRRNWYGRMFLPPGEAWLAEHQTTYGAVRTRLVSQAALYRASPTEQNAEAMREIALPAGCGLGMVAAGPTTGAAGAGAVQESAPSYGNHLRSVYGAAASALSFTDMVVTTCPSGEISCWATCMPTAPYNLTCPPYEIICVDTSGNPADPTLHVPSNHPGCIGEYVDPGGFCQGSGVNMYMEGFVSYVTGKYRTAGGSTTPQCLVLWFEDWKLDSKGKFAAACIGCILVGILTEAFTTLRRRARDVLRSKPELLQKFMHCVLYASHLVFSYFCMLIAMTYQVELFVCVIAGLAIGHGLFHYKPVVAPVAVVAGKNNGFTDADKGYQGNNVADDDVVDPCCQYLSMEDDSEHSTAPALPTRNGNGNASNNPLR